MKIPGKRFYFLKHFLIFLFFILGFTLRFVLAIESPIVGCVVFVVLIAISAILSIGADRISYEGHTLIFDASGVTEYGSFGFVRHHKWEEYKLRCILSKEGERDLFYFYNDRIDLRHLKDVRYLYYLEERPPKWNGFYTSMGSISATYTPEQYEAFRVSCPNVRLIRLDSEGSVYYITDSEEEILIAESKRPNETLTLEEFRKGVEALAASGFLDIAGILSATGLQLSEEPVAKADAAVKAEVPAQAAAEEIRASAESASADEAVEAIRASAAREVEEIRASTARELEALRASTAAFVDEDSEEDEFADEEYEDEFAEEYFEDEEFADEDE